MIDECLLQKVKPLLSIHKVDLLLFNPLLIVYHQLADEPVDLTSSVAPNH